MKTAGTWNDIPGFWINVRERWIATHYGWGKIMQLVREIAQERCEFHLLNQGPHHPDCPDYTRWGDTHHRFGRAGGKRDDRVFLDNGMKNLFYLSRFCHDRANIERRLPAGDCKQDCQGNNQTEQTAQSVV